jgi:hypothetical protein
MASCLRSLPKALVGLVIAVAAGYAGGLGRGIQAQQPSCLHGPDESAEQQQRRVQALTVARQVNTLQAQAAGRTGSYEALGRLPLTAQTPTGFIVHLASDGSTYSFSVIDSTDPCRFGYFSNADGVIYAGQSLR